MTYSTSLLTFKEPTANDVKTDSKLAETIRSLNKTRRDSFFHLCIIAYGLRKQNLEKTTGQKGGKNKKGESYKKGFWDWYIKEKLAEVYGSDTSFSQYANSGRLLNYIRWNAPNKNGEILITRMPASASKLAAIASYWAPRGRANQPEDNQRLFSLIGKKDKDGSGPMLYSINPEVELESIKKIVGKTTDKPTTNNNKKNEFLIFQIYADQSLRYGKAKTTKNRLKGSVHPDQVNKLLSDINSIIKAHNKETASFSVDTEPWTSLKNKIKEDENYGKHT